jgi:hypothetical protein
MAEVLIDGGIAISHAGHEAFLAVSPPVLRQAVAEVAGAKDLIDRAVALADRC